MTPEMLEKEPGQVEQISKPLPPAARDEFVEDAARLTTGGATIEHVAALYGMTPAQVLVSLEDPCIAALVDRAAAKAERDGTALRQRARVVISDAMSKLAAVVAQDDVSPSFLLRVMDVLGKHIVEPRADKAQAPQTIFSIHIDMGEHSVSLAGVSLQNDSDVVDI
jgi:hypothetical protein